MSLYAIGDLHLSFGTNKPMNIFGNNWNNYESKIESNWKSIVTENDTVILLGDFSWGMYINETKKDFEFINNLPGKKILLKGNHDYWWTTVSKMNTFLKENGLKNIYFLYNNSYLYNEYIVAGVRGWKTGETDEDIKVKKRENIRLELSIKDGINKYGEDKKIIVCTHYPPFDEINLITTMKKYNVEKCLYAHLHGEAHKEAKEGIIEGIDYKLLSADYVDFKLMKILD